MCNRYTYKLTCAEIAAEYGVEVPPGLPGWGERSNVALTEDVPVVRLGATGRCEAVLLRWGLPQGGTIHEHYNARVETASHKHTFAVPFARRRCILPASGFYEWQDNPGQRPQPWYFHDPGGRPLSIGGIWSSEDGRESVCLLTTAANPDVAPLHDRMPLLLAREDFERWLQPVELTWNEERHFGAPPAPGRLLRYTVSLRVNRAGETGEDLTRPAKPAPRQAELF